MSYEIVYDKQFIKITPNVIDGQDWYVPVVLHGSSNTYESNLLSGKNRRHRYWSSLYFSGANQLPWLSETSIMEKINSLAGGYGEHFMLNGNYVDDEGLIKFFKNGIKSAKTIEDIVKMGVRVKAYISKWDGDTKSIILNEYISNTDSLRDWLLRAKLELRNRGGSSCYVMIGFTSEKLDKSALKQNVPELEHYYVIEIEGSKTRKVYIERSTSKRVLLTSDVKDARKFRTEKLAQDWISAIVERGYKEKLRVVKIK